MTGMHCYTTQRHSHHRVATVHCMYNDLLVQFIKVMTLNQASIQDIMYKKSLKTVFNTCI